MTIINVIRKNAEFQTVFNKGHSMYGRYLVVYFLHNDYNHCRFGFCVGKKLGTAVVRNRIKRLFREAVRKTKLVDIVGWDILIVARYPVLKAQLNDIVNELNILTNRARI